MILNPSVLSAPGEEEGEENEEGSGCVLWMRVGGYSRETVASQGDEWATFAEPHLSFLRVLTFSLPAEHVQLRRKSQTTSKRGRKKE